MESGARLTVTALVQCGLVRRCRSSGLVGGRSLGELAVADLAQHVGVLDDEVGAMRTEDSKLGKPLEADRDRLARYARHMRQIGVRERRGDQGAMMLVDAVQVRQMQQELR